MAKFPDQSFTFSFPFLSFFSLVWGVYFTCIWAEILSKEYLSKWPQYFLESWEKIYKTWEKRWREGTVAGGSSIERLWLFMGRLRSRVNVVFLSKTKGLSSPFSKCIASIEDKMLDLIQFSFIPFQLEQLWEI